MFKAVIAQMVAERPLGQQAIRIDRADDAEVAVGVEGQGAGAPDHSHAAAAEGAGKTQLAHAFGQRHDRRHRHRRRAAHEHIHAERLAGPHRRGVVHADRTMDLIMESNFAVRRVLVPGQLNAVHAEIRAPQARLADILGVDDRQRDEWPAVSRPTHQLRQLTNTSLLSQHGAAAHKLRQHARRIERRPPVLPRPPRRRLRLSAQGHQSLHPGERIAKHQPRALDRAEEIADHRKPATDDAGEVHGRPSRRVDAAVDGCGLEPGVNGRVDPDELPVPIEVVNAFAEAAITHATPGPEGIKATGSAGGRLRGSTRRHIGVHRQSRWLTKGRQSPARAYRGFRAAVTARRSWRRSVCNNRHDVSERHFRRLSTHPGGESDGVLCLLQRKIGVDAPSRRGAGCASTAQRA